jgi:hypothetical protein
MRIRAGEGILIKKQRKLFFLNKREKFRRKNSYNQARHQGSIFIYIYKKNEQPN